MFIMDSLNEANVTMTSSSVFVALVELRPLEGCLLDPRSIAGAWVRCYVSAPTKDLAIAKLHHSFQENHFDLVETEWCVNESEVEWEKPDDSIGKGIISAARQNDDVAYGEFHVWSHDAHD